MRFNAGCLTEEQATVLGSAARSVHCIGCNVHTIAD